MGLLSGLLGNAAETNAEKLEKEFDSILYDGEEIQRAYKFIRDLLIFTDKRLVMVDRQGITGKRVEYHSIPYRSIYHFAVETAGHFDLDGELKIWVGSDPEPIETEFKRGTDIRSAQQMLAKYVAT